MKPQYKFITFISSITCICLVLYKAGQDMRTNHQLSSGKIITWNKGGRGDFGPTIYYVYQRGSVAKSASRRHSELIYSIKELENHFFPVVYQKHWWGYIEEILITPKDFEYYGYSFPDSQKWVLKYIRR
jgi:hypothetical protein